ncbi:MAG: cytochrome C oxidase subunit III [Halobacteriovoraceae bacterium]|nr:cytochrome C oxidase subunit III [Halobacteriovoraceae bacterium]|tara:strand:+ start:4729 stop:5469 length:741 start_codon:yes stop_codon:yes gene_type:complete
MSTASYDKKEQAAHHFKDLNQQHDAGKEGVWLFMATEIMMFGGLFVGYFIYRFMFPDTYMAGGDSLNWYLGAFNTLVLLLSSFTMAQAVTETMKGNNQKAYKLIVVTTLCAFAFMVVKYFEYTAKIDHGLFPGFDMWNAQSAIEYANNHLRSDAGFTLALPAAGETLGAGQVDGSSLKLFFVLYFCMTGLHGLHITIGIGLMFWLMKRLKNNEFGPKYYTAVEGVGLYWHIVDVIWIFLFPLMYLI